MEQQNGDMEWQEEGETNEGTMGQNRARKQTTSKSAGGMVEAVQSLKPNLSSSSLNSDRMAEEVTGATTQLAQELSQVRDQLTQTETPRSPGRTYADAARMIPARMSSQSLSAARSATPEPVFCTVDTSRVPEDHIGDATPTMIHKTVEREMRRLSDQPQWRCAAVTRDGRNANRLRIIGRNEEEIQKIKTILETRKAPGARVLRHQLYPIKVDSMNRMAVFDQEFNVLPGVMEP
ncbi:hypothetical protein F53441_13343 [Fusarium austroafricanum]|uniref:Uncharacterized protein n=1 Tax=Fusarium austroafricanum TaxID=2364996 RepID=A0A8H4JR23_9HYPO|nr:hypothetical protein F53441_13343 [Fusarium austroafricanum]